MEINQFKEIIEETIQNFFATSKDLARPWNPKLSKKTNKELEQIILSETPVAELLSKTGIEPDWFFDRIYHAKLHEFIHRSPEPLAQVQ